MKTGDHVTDGKGRTFQVGQLLGRGLWGKCYLAREDGDGTEWVLKVPLGEDDLPQEPPRLAEICREIAREQGRLLDESGNEALAEVETRFVADDGSPTLVLPRYPETLERRMAELGTMDEVLQSLMGAMNALQVLAKLMPVHGGLKPSNIMIDEDGSVRLMDPVTPTLKRHLTALASRDGYLGDAYLPPEVQNSTTEPVLSAGCDTYALAMMLYRAGVHDGSAKTPLSLPTGGLQKGDVQTLKDSFRNRLKNEPSNPRFHARMSDRAAAIVNRGICAETSPSPPFRFNKLDEFKTRMSEVTALVHPTIAHVGKLILTRPPTSAGFTTDEEVRFSCTVGATQGVETHEEISAGLAVFDQEGGDRVRNLACSYTVDRHPSGRFRFSFRIADLPPGQYLVRIAYTIRDSGHEPITAEEGFQVTAAPGYVPPRAEPERQAITMDRPEQPDPSEDTVTGHFQPPGLDDPTYEQPDVQVEAEVTPLHPNSTDEHSGIEHGFGDTTLNPALDDHSYEEEEQTEPVPFPIGGPTTDPSEADEPVYQGAGRWSELPLPNTGQQDLESPSAPLPHQPAERQEAGPIAEMISWLIGRIRSDSYLLFLSAAGLVIVVLLLALWIMP